jgi:hypothetical protein
MAKGRLVKLHAAQPSGREDVREEEAPAEQGGELAQGMGHQDEKQKSWIYACVLTGKAAAETAVAIKGIVDEINHSYRAQAVWSLRSDMGKEFLAKAVRAVARDKGLHPTTGPGYDPDSNARAERGIGILKDSARRLNSG